MHMIGNVGEWVCSLCWCCGLRSKKEAMKYRFDLRSNFDGKS